MVYLSSVDSARFAAGEHALYRGVHIDDSARTGPPVIADLKPVVVVEDSDAAVKLFAPAGVRTMVSRPIPAGRPKPWGPGEWELAPARWDRWNAVFEHSPGKWSSTWTWWTPDWEFIGWYVNLQEPIWRTRWGFDARDLQLDIVVAPDRSWRWKDEDDLARSIETGLISEANAERARAAGAEAIAEIEARRGPFADGVERWRPPREWATPVLPADGELRDVLRWTPADSLGQFV